MPMYYEKPSSDAETEATPLRAMAAPKHVPSAALVRVQVVTVCLAYAIVGPSLVLVNNHILKNLHFPFPLILSSIGLVTTACVCYCVIHLPRLSRLLPRACREAGTPRRMHAIDPGTPTTPGAPLAIESSSASLSGGVTFSFWLWNMVPIGAAQGLTFASTNAAYMYLTITFTQMLAAFTPSVTLALLYVSGIEVPTTRATLAVVAIGLGCVLSSLGEGQFHPLGVAFRSVGIFSEATRLVLTQKLLKNHKLSIFESQCYLAPVGAAFLLLGAVFTELRRFRRSDALQTIASHPLLFSASSVLGVAASMLTFIVIKLTNSVTLKVINTARNAAFVLFTVLVLGEQASAIQVAGYGLSVAAFSCYVYIKTHHL